MKHTFDNVYVNRLDLVKMAADLRENFDEDIAIKAFGGLILKPKVGLIDTEIVLRPLPANGEFEISIWPADKDIEGGGKRMSMFPKWSVNLTVAELEKYVMDAMPLGEFVKGRRGYNSRLEQNEYAVTKWLNKKEKPA